MIPSQNVGMDNAKRKMTDAPTSTRVARFAAATMPSANPTTAAKMVLAAASVRVAGKRSAISWLTSSFEVIDSPKLPWRTLRRMTPYWSRRGRFRPNACSMR